MLKRYFKIWWLYASNSFQMQFTVRLAFLIFLLGKILRFTIFTFFIVLLLQNTKVLAGYSLDQTIFFFLSFNLLDVISQMVFREVYKFRSVVLSGNFDFYLVKPVNPLFRSLFGSPDVLDFFTLIPLIFAVIYFMDRVGGLNFYPVAMYVLLIISGLIISLSFHILVLSLAIVTLEIDHAIMVYRDIVGLGRMPIDIYKEPIRGLLTFVIPVGIMMSYPAKAFLGLLSPALIIYGLFFSVVLFFGSLKIWDYSIRKYSSASS